MEPPAAGSPAPRTTARTLPIALVIAMAALALIAVVIAYLAGRARGLDPRLAPMTSSSVEVRPSPNVILAVRELQRLESAEFHMERVLELSDQQSRFFGLVQAKDALLLVAVGDVVAGVDLASLRDADVTVDWAKRSVHVHLPDAQIFAVTIDNARTRVVSRNTDALATRKEELEGRARSEAERSMREAAIEGGILDRAKTGAIRAVRELARGLGFETVVVD